MILFELDRLQASIDEALQASRRPPQGFSHGLPSDSRVARNLRNLAEAARHFHSTASSTATSTIHDRTAGSVLGNFPAYRRERVETFIRSTHGNAATTDHETPVTHGPLLPPSVSSAPRSPPLVNPRPLRVVTSSPRWSFVEDDEDDEDDEAEFERSFAEELKDLARDSIRLGQFEKAISLFTDAIQRREKAGAAKHEVQRLQTQLALCHFFNHDWKQAEPIVSALARSVESLSSLDSVVWTMLHALALAYLSTYAFDDALTMCKKAMQAMRKWARRTRLDRTNVVGWADTTGLLATISEMQGDYIAAEIYRRQLPEHFVYRHCSDPREFLSAQSDVLQLVLGTDLPDFCRQRSESFVNGLPGFHELHRSTQPRAENASAQRLGEVQRTHTVNGGGDVSPLRARRHEWEKFEMDTAKEVIVPTSPSSAHETDDADDEATSTASSNPHSPTGIDGIRRIMATRILGTGLGRDRAPGGAETDSDASPTASPVRRWLEAGDRFAGKLSKVMLRKRPSNDSTSPLLGGKPPQTFRVLRVQRFGSSTIGPSWNSPTSGANLERSLENCSSAPELSGEACAACPAPPPSPAHEEADNFTVRTDMPADSSPRCGRGSQTLTLRDGHSSITVPEARPTFLESDNHSSTMPPTGAVTNGRESPWDVMMEEAHLMATPGFRETKKVVTLLIPAGGRDMLRRAALQLPPITAALTHEQATALTRLASILISSTARKRWGADRLHATKLELEALSTGLGRWSTDLTLRRDLQMVIDALGARAARLDQRQGQDSGYESMGHESGSEEGALVDREGSGSEAGRTGELRRRSSWLAGDDAAYQGRPENLQSPLTLNARDHLLLAASNLRVVEWSPGTDPADAVVSVMRVEDTVPETEGSEGDGRESTQGGRREVLTNSGADMDAS
jgi:hypothetical protein